MEKRLQYIAEDINALLDKTEIAVDTEADRELMTNTPIARAGGLGRVVYVKATKKSYQYNIDTGEWVALPTSGVEIDAEISSTSENPVQNKVISGALDKKQDKLTAGENITIQNNVISVDGETIKTFSGGDTTRDNNSEFYDFLRTLTPGEYFWLDRLKNNNHNRYSTVAGKILMQLVSVPESYTMPGSDSAISKTSRVELVNCFKLLAKGFTYEDKDVDLKDGPFTFNYNTIHKYDLTADLSDTKEYELYFAERAIVGVNLNAHVEYSFVGVSTTISANKPSTKVITRLDAITSITENNDQAVTSGAVYAALQGKQATLTSEQLNAVNSGATTTKINQIATNTTNITSLQTGKQDKLTNTQLTAVNSGITDTKVTQIETNATNITSLQTGKQDKLTAGTGITIQDNVISARTSQPVYKHKLLINVTIGTYATTATYNYLSNSSEVITDFALVDDDFNIGASNALADNLVKVFGIRVTKVGNVITVKGTDSTFAELTGSATLGNDVVSQL